MKNFLTISWILFFSLNAFSDTPLFQYGGKDYPLKDLDYHWQRDWYEAEKHNNNFYEKFFNNFISDEYFAEEAAKKKKTKEQIKETLLKVKEPNEKEIKEFYEKNKERIPYPLDKIKADLKNIIVNEKKFNTQNELVEKIKKERGFKLLISEPTPPKLTFDLKGITFQGSDSGKIELVEVIPPHCKNCKAMQEKLIKIVNQNKTHLRYYQMLYKADDSWMIQQVGNIGDESLFFIDGIEFKPGFEHRLTEMEIKKRVK